MVEVDEAIVIKSQTTATVGGKKSEGIANLSDEVLMKAMLKGRSVEEFLRSDDFLAAVAKVSEEKGVAPLEVAKGFVDSVLGTVNTVGLGTVNTLEQFIDNVLDTTYGAAKGLNKTAADLGRGLVNTVTLQNGK